MKNKKILVIVLCFLSGTILSQGFEKIYDFAKYDVIDDFNELNNGDFMLLINSWENDFGEELEHLIRINENGDTLWTKSDSIYRGSGFLQFNENYYYFAGGIDPTAYLTKTDTNFNVIWQHTQYLAGVFISYSHLNKLNDSKVSYIENSAPYGYASLQKKNKIINLDGEILNITPNQTSDIAVTNDSVFYVCGEDYWGDTNIYIRIRKQSSTEPFEQDTNFNSWKIEHAYKSHLLINNDTVYVFSRMHVDSTYNLLAISAIDAISGDSLFTKYIQTDDYLRDLISVCITDNNDFLILLRINENNKNLAAIIRTNSIGDLISVSYIDKFVNFYPSKIRTKGDYMYITGFISPDSGVIVRGDGYLLKAPIDTVMVGIDHKQYSSLEAKFFKLFPNPVNSELRLTFSKFTRDGYRILINDLTGVEVKNYILPQGNRQYKMNLNELKSGIYVISLFENGKLLQTEKFVVAK